MTQAQRRFLKSICWCRSFSTSENTCVDHATQQSEKIKKEILAVNITWLMVLNQENRTCQFGDTSVQENYRQKINKQIYWKSRKCLNLNRGIPHGVIAGQCWTAASSSNSSLAITFTFGLRPLGRAWTFYLASHRLNRIRAFFNGWLWH